MSPSEVHWDDPRNIGSIIFSIVVLVLFIDNNFVAYNGPLAKFLGREMPQVRALHILVPTEEEATAVMTKLTSGAANPTMDTFCSLASKCSTCRSREDPDTPGDLGKLLEGFMRNPKFDEVCFDPKTALNTPHGPVKTDSGYHIIWLTERVGIDTGS